MKHCFLILLAAFVLSAKAQPLTVENIMKDPKWIGVAPSNPSWSIDSQTLYFSWNPDQAVSDSLYKVTLANLKPVKVSKRERLSLPGSTAVFNKNRTKVLYEKDGDLFLQDVQTKSVSQLTNTLVTEYNPLFSRDERKIIYTSEQNLFSWELGSAKITQLTDFRKGKKNVLAPLSEQEKWLKEDQLSLFAVLKARDQKKKLADKSRENEKARRPKEVYLDEKNVDQVRMSADEKYITFRLTKTAKPKNTIVPNYVTPSGFTEDINARTKVGAPLNTQELFLYDIAADTVFQITTEGLPGIDEKIQLNTAPNDDGKKGGETKKIQRQVNFMQINWSPFGGHAVVVIRSADNKDRWLGLLNAASHKLTSIDRLHDDAWVTLSTGWSSAPGSGWLDDKRIWFLSEASGYSHLYTLDVTSGEKRALTSGRFEVQEVVLAETRKTFYLTTNEVHPGEKQFYKLPVAGGKLERITTMTGAHEVEVSPDEKNIAFRYSYSNKPWELFLMENKSGAKSTQITNSLSAEFKAYPWRDPEVVTFKARDGETVYARLYKPAKPTGAAVIFVHGAGYLQNAHKWWSSYFREYMFHNLLTDKGYTVLDIDFRASAGYGREWRTGMYQFMGGKDLTDNLDGAKYLVDNHNVDPMRMGIYGGSYGGFITLMAMFTTPDAFAAGAALRPVTDWAHYNHGYTANILNTPVTDSLAYAKSSPIYYADGLKGSLLICHGMVDVNVHFQDVVRLSQRLIELGKENWELAVYPVEDHGFVEPSSWTDEYKRILKLFDTTLK